MEARPDLLPEGPRERNEAAVAYNPITVGSGGGQLVGGWVEYSIVSTSLERASLSLSLSFAYSKRVDH